MTIFFGQSVFAQSPFVTTWRTDSTSVGSSNATSVTIPTTGTGYNYDIDWNNDGNYDNIGVTGNITHDYGVVGTYTIAIRGSFPRIYFNNTGDCKKLLSIDQWGSIAWANMAFAFANCSNMVLNATDVPNTAAVTDMSFMFRACSKLNQALPAGFNTSNVTSMTAMFSRCTIYNQPLPTSFTTANVTSMNAMFFNCAAYNQPFPVGFTPAADLSSMFQGASSFNQNISTWNTSAVSNMASMFSGATAFNQNIGSFNIAATTIMLNIFLNSGISKANYDAILTAWNSAGYVNKNLGNASPLVYCTAQAARLNLASTLGWTITGDLLACVSPEMNIKGNGVSIIDGDITPSLTDHTAFGFLADPNSTIVRTFTIENTGIDPLNLTGTPKVLISGVNSADFTVNVQPNSPIAATNGTSTFQITFAPTAPGIRIATVSIANDDANENPYNFVIRGNSGKPFITKWRTDSLSAGSSNATSVTIPIAGTGYFYDIDWNNDGTYDDLGVAGSITHDYGVVGTYIVAIRGVFPRIYFNNAGDKKKLLSIEQWGEAEWSNMASAFYGCTNLVLNATDVPNTSAVTDMSYMFGDCFSLNQALPNGINTSNVTNMSFMYSNCKTYNQPLPASFTTANVTNMNSMFGSCYAYNQPLPASFNTENVTNMAGMFFNCTVYNQALPASFNTLKVTEMNTMFWGCLTYNQPLPANFNTANVTKMSSMFNSCIVFNQALPSSFNTAKVTDMSRMFQNCTAYNQALPTSFNTALVTNMDFMFSGARAYNQAFPAAFTTASVTSMSFMFLNANAFDQNIGNFNIAAATSMTNIFNNSGISLANYDAILTAWNSAGYTNKNIGTAAPLIYCNAQTARNNLTTILGWTITGDALNCTPSEINLKGNGATIVDGDSFPTNTDHTDFGSTPVLGGSIVRTFTIENTGSGPLTISGVSIGGAHSGDFSVSLMPSSPIAANTGTTTFQLSFDPSGAGLRLATVNISNNDPNENPYNFNIQGIGCGGALVNIVSNIQNTAALYAADIITASNKINNASVEYRGARAVTLQPGFRAEGNTFKAQIGIGCN